mgnify:CR=1 FL=1
MVLQHLPIGEPVPQVRLGQGTQAYMGTSGEKLLEIVRNGVRGMDRRELRPG